MLFTIGDFLFGSIWHTAIQLDVHNGMIRYHVRHNDFTYYIIIKRKGHISPWVGVHVESITITSDIIKLHSSSMGQFTLVDVEVTKKYQLTRE